MAGSGVVWSVDRVSDRNDAPVWRLWLAPGPGNADARAILAANRPVVGANDPPTDIAVNIERRDDVAPIAAGDTIRWDAHHVWNGQTMYRKIGWEYDPNAPLR